jgi:UDP-N-acetyl-D-mannosaminuronic acid dehydrogenase
MEPIRTIAVIGLGYVGLPTAALLAGSGYDVLGIDIDERVVSALKEGRCENAEPEVKALVEQGLASGRLKVSQTPAVSDAFIVCVPTPVRADNSADLSLVDAATRSIAPFVRPGNLVILESTSPIGTIDNVVVPILRQAGLEPGEDVDICYCPERVFPGNSINEMVENSRVVGGSTERATERAAALYGKFCRGQVLGTSAASAEFVKLMENTFRDVNIALANVFARVAEKAGIDVMDTIRVANGHPRVNVLHPGAGVGGHCIAVDPWFLIRDFPDVTELLSVAREVNDSQPTHLLERAEAAGLAKGSRVAILGVAYRGNINDSRGSPSERLADVLGMRGYKWTAHDPYVSRWEMHGGNMPIYSDLSAALNGTDAAFVMTDHDAYRSLGPDDFSGMNSRLIVDGRRLLAEQPLADAGFTVVRVGAPTLQQ